MRPLSTTEKQQRIVPAAVPAEQRLAVAEAATSHIVTGASASEGADI